MRILFLQKRPLFPADTGGKIRTGNILRHLAEWHEVAYLCNLQPGEKEAVPEMEAMGLRVETIPWRETSRNSWKFYGELAANLLTRLPFNVAKDTDVGLRRRAQELLDAEPFDLIVCDFVQMAGNAVDLIGPPKVLFQHNVEAEIFERHAKLDRGLLRRTYMAYQANKMRQYEGSAGRQFDAVIAVSERDRDQFEQRYGWSHVETIDTAVDVDFFEPRGAASDPNLVTFVGSMDWLPNIDGVDYLVREIWPRVRAARPESRLQVVGRNPAADVLRHDGKGGVEVTGGVPDVRTYYENAAVVVVPLRMGGGTRIKIYESMAMARPVVSTSLGAEGLKFEDGEHLVLADDPDSFAKRIVELLADTDRRQRMGNAARRHVCENFSSEAVARQFEEICLATARTNGLSAQTEFTAKPAAASREISKVGN